MKLTSSTGSASRVSTLACHASSSSNRKGRELYTVAQGVCAQLQPVCLDLGHGGRGGRQWSGVRHEDIHAEPRTGLADGADVPLSVTFSLCLLAYMLVMFAIGWVAQRKVENVDDYVLAADGCR